MEFETSQHDNAVVIHVKGRMDAVTAPEFEKECSPHVESDVARLVIDLSELAYISSAGLRSILSTAKKMKTSGGEIRFCGLSGMVQEVFSISGFSSMFTICETLNEALDQA